MNLKNTLFFVLCSVLFIVACGGNNGTSGNPDSGTDSGQPPLCASVNCDDKVACTRDSCVEATGECRHQADHALCTAGTVCMPKEGCESPPPCANDGDCPDVDNGPCMQEYCDSASATCRWNPLDKDGDGHAPQICADIGGDDCDDDDYSRHPGVEEQCNRVDDNCNGTVDDIKPGAGYPFHQDQDRDGAGNPDVIQEACSAPDGYVANAEDCDDTDRDISPAAVEICDDRDNNCDGNRDEESEENPLCGSCLVCQNATCVAMTCEEELVCIPETNRCGYDCPDPNNLPLECVPREYREAYCVSRGPGVPGQCRIREVLTEIPCSTDAPCQEAWTEIPCSTDAQCHDFPPDQWPPCVCWEFCGFIGKWQCPVSVWDIDFFPEETSKSNVVCYIGKGFAIGTPGNPRPRDSIQPEIEYELSEDGQTLTMLTATRYSCSKLN